jgi:DNA-binding PadR family transcriptional regulator
MLRPCLLLLLREGDGHGYDLVERLRVFGLDCGGPGPVYHALKRMERDGLVVSIWEAAIGPARRVYELTAEGQAALDAWSARLLDLEALLADYADRYRNAPVAERADHTLPAPT